MIRHRNLHPDTRKRYGVSRVIDMSVDAATMSVVAFDPDQDIKVRRATIVFTLDGSTGTVQNIQLGVQGALTRYAAFAHNIVAATNQAGDVETVTMTNLTTLVPRGTALVVTRAAGAATNTSDLQVVVEYELVDRLS